MLRWFRRRLRAGASSGDGWSREDMEHLANFARTRQGVEGFVEPRTAVTDTTLLLVAGDGEWTRRRVPDAARAHQFANKLGIPSYDAQVVGYPKRMREWNAKRAAAEKDALGKAGDVGA
ncbi:hypothetical protein [Thermasporomyces composti]|jgi:hypothetical protein|uniref:Uncharacterized protein n=1 Tax=Thermasporomyces composti TaxID=696763 RepID=A0A3D9V7C4_THECX|nr:hypothetical protein [Thermasporomyces composti]REF34935.1 hypothetical protein DFJ64_0301 [Thermasporomyces composti]